MKKVLITIGLSMMVVIAWLMFNHFRVLEPVINSQKSEVAWSAKSISGGHFGKIQIKESTVLFRAGALIGGTIVMDMNKITVDDIEDIEDKQDFIGHISNEDFFEVTNFPEAHFKIKESKKSGDDIFTVVGELTIKEITHPLTLEIEVVESEEGKFAKASFSVDRTKYGIVYGAKGQRGSEKDWFIYDEFNVNVNLKIE